MRRTASAAEGWAVFNLDVDPCDFDFEVALGAEVIGDREEHSTIIYRFPLEAKAWCKVFIHDDQRPKKWPSHCLPPRKVEVLSSMTEKGKELDLDDPFEKQFSLALRLFKPAPFWFVEWTRKNEIRVPEKGWQRYELTGNHLRRFRVFTTKLLPFHVERKLFEHARDLPKDLEKDVRELLGGSKAAEQQLLARAAQLMIAAELFDRAHKDRHVSSEWRLILLAMASEALFGEGDKGKLSYRLAVRMAALNGGSGAERKKIFERARSLYDLRSHLVHGSLYRKKEFVRVADTDVQEFSNLVRGALLYFIGLRDLPRDELLRVLDRAIFDNAELAVLRARANRFWGLGESPDEHLYSADWPV
jgi:hypothetical protein